MRRGILLVAAALLWVGVASANTAPLTDAGLDQRVTRNATVYLDAGGTTDPDGNVTGYEWTITDPNGTTLSPRCRTCERTEFVPRQVGTYEVTVTATDDDGATRSDTLYVRVDPASPPSVDVFGPEAISAGTARTYTANATAGEAPLSTIGWYVDGSHRAYVAVGGDSATVTRSFSLSPGDHNVTAVIIDANGHRDTDDLDVRAVDTSGGGAVLNIGGGGGVGAIDPSKLDGSGGCGICGPDGLITLTIDGSGKSKSATWEVNQELASRMGGSGATVEIAGTEVHVNKIAKINEENEDEEVVKIFEKEGVSERKMVEAAAGGISEKDSFRASGEGSLNTINNERNSLEYTGFLPPKDSSDGSSDSSLGDSPDSAYGGSSTADKLFSGAGSSTDSNWNSSGGDGGGGNSDGSSGSSESDSGGYHGGSSYTGGGGYGF